MAAVTKNNQIYFKIAGQVDLDVLIIMSDI
jgi:hypothetical protein